MADHSPSKAAIIQDENVVAITPNATGSSTGSNGVVDILGPKLHSLLNLSSDDEEAVLMYLSSIGCTSIEDLFFVDKEDLVQSSLPLVIQRKLFLVSEYLREPHGDKTFAKIDSMGTLMERVRRSTKASSRNGNESDNTSIHHQSSKVAEEIIHLDVGGYKFTTTRTTLCRVPGSVLEAIFSRRHENSALCNKDGEYIIDRRGTHFEYVLDFLRVGAVVTLPRDKQAKDELAVEADYYGLDELVRAIKRPIIDIGDFIPQEIRRIRAGEEKIRTVFRENRGAGVSSHQGLIPLFDPDHGADTMPLKFVPMEKPEQLCPALGTGEPTEPGTPVTVESLDRFRHFFNRHHADVLHRLNDVLLEEPVIIAGGSILRALTANRVRMSRRMWESYPSDVDIFIHTKDRSEANRIARRIFFSLAVDPERWAITRSKGVINLFKWVGERWTSRITEKIQIIIRLYESPSEVLHGFDCDSCCCAYDGREVWVTPRWLFALRHGVNVLNPLHSWPNKPSYELRLAKYAYRGFAVLVPGLDLGRIDHRSIHTKPLDKLRGLARLVKIFLETEAVPRHSTKSSLRFPRDVDTLRDAVDRQKSQGALLAMGQGGYEELGLNVIVPNVYGNATSSAHPWWFGFESDFPIARLCRDEAWNDIVHASGSIAIEGIPDRLLDAWDFVSKGSREYLNAGMDKADLDQIYYGHAYYEEGEEKAES